MMGNCELKELKIWTDDISSNDSMYIKRCKGKEVAC